MYNSRSHSTSQINDKRATELPWKETTFINNDKENKSISSPPVKHRVLPATVVHETGEGLVHLCLR